jgi:hypothetical protein
VVFRISVDTDFHVRVVLQFCFQGGRLEASIRLPGRATVAGLWPAFWTMGNLGRGKAPFLAPHLLAVALELIFPGWISSFFSFSQSVTVDRLMEPGLIRTTNATSVPSQTKPTRSPACRRLQKPRAFFPLLALSCLFVICVKG